MRNYDYLPDDVDALKAEIERLDREVRAAKENSAAADIRVAVLAEREACAKVADAYFGDPRKAIQVQCTGRDIAAAIRNRPA